MHFSFIFVFFRQRFFCLIVLLLSSVTTPYANASIMASKPDFSELEKAPLIISGKVESFFNPHKQIIKQFTEVINYDVKISVWHVIKGNLKEKDIVVHNHYKPIKENSYIGRQKLDLNVQYIFFLKMNIDGEFIGIDPVEFAIETIDLPDLKGNCYKDKLSEIAKGNILKANELPAVRWMELFVELYNKEKDQKFLQNVTKIKHNRLQGLAIAILCRNDTEHNEKLYQQAMHYLTKNLKNGSVWKEKNKIIKALEKSSGNKLPHSEVKKWLYSKNNKLQEAAFRIISKDKDETFTNDIIQMMLMVKNREIQYNCVKVLYAVFKNHKGTPAYHLFQNSPRKYVIEWQRWWQQEKRNQKRKK